MLKNTELKLRYVRSVCYDNLLTVILQFIMLTSFSSSLSPLVRQLRFGLRHNGMGEAFSKKLVIEARSWCGKLEGIWLEGNTNRQEM